MRIASIALLGLLLLASFGCGSERGSASGGRGLASVIHAVPGDQAVNAVDLEEARKQLGLPDDAGSLKPGRRGAANLQLAIVAATALPFASTLDPALIKSIDLGKMQQAATGGLIPTTRVTAMRFKGAAGDVLQKLGQAGWKQRNDVFQSPAGSRPTQFAGQGRDELVLLSPSLAALQRARQGKAAGGRLRALADSLRQPVRIASTLGSSGCLAAIAGGDEIQPPSGQLVVVPKAKPAADRLGHGRRFGATRLAPAKIDGNRVVATYRGARGRARGQIAPQLIARFVVDDVYRCR